MANHRFNCVGNTEKESLSAYDIQKLVEYRNIYKMGENQYPFYLQKSYSVRGKRTYQ